MIYRRNPQRNIVLTGFYSSGKRTVGREVARRLRRPFIDLEAEIRHRMRMNLHSLTGLGNRPEICLMEAKLIRGFAQRQGLVIALGTDTLANQDYLAELKDHSYLVFLDPPYDTLWHRIQCNPGLEDVVQRFGRNGLHRLVDDHRATYEKCDLHIISNAASQYETAKLILHCYYT